MKRKYKTKIFDVDGILLDTFGPSYQMDKELIKKYGGNPPTSEEYKEAIVDTNWEGFYENFSVPKKNISHLLKDYKANFIENPRAIPGSKEILSKINSPYIVSLCGDKPGLIKRLQNGRILDFFKQGNIYCPSKSKVESLEEISIKTKSPKEKMVFIGDSVSDIKDCKEFGIDIVAIANEYSYCTKEMLESANPNYLLRDIRELNKVLGGQK